MQLSAEPASGAVSDLVSLLAELRTEMEFFYRAHNVSSLKAVLLELAAQFEGHFMISEVSPLTAVRNMDTPILLAHGRQQHRHQRPSPGRRQQRSGPSEQQLDLLQPRSIPVWHRTW